MPYPSSFPPLPLPEVDLWTLLFERPSKPFPDTKPIFTDHATSRAHTYSSVRAAAASFGAGLKARWRWRKGDVLALYTPNSIDTAVVTLGALWAGGVVSPANPLYTVDELARQLRDCGARALVTQRRYLDTAREAARRVGMRERRIILVGDERDGTGRFRHYGSVRGTSYTGSYARTRVEPKTDLAFLVYSSGTTGLPKGVCLTHANMVANLLQFAAMDGRTFFPTGGLDGQGDRQLGILPLFHIYGLMCGILGSLYLGLELVVLERFDLETALRCIQDRGCTFAYVPPPIVLAFGKDPLVDKYDLSSLKMLHSGAAPLTRELTEAVWRRLGVPVKQGFGLSETGSVTHVQSWDEWAKYMGSVGKLVPNMEARLVGEDGKEVGDGESGELWLRGPNIFVGYYKQPERTAEAFAEGGWFRTGDVFRRDKWGNYYCVDRLKELIKYSESSLGGRWPCYD
ncbi:acetyl-CoA synthetase-like protein [Coniochaeta ligniaria NRRL 30616]|uniref:Acetyl-CoA synthetase-like protein n=1 Tax=Coniochaeta ligniaria NRRL 30616 TaxID=1408157 RepID=A0A1J7K4C3_9PEZI|nr:acetyl-CoA synthetase-like protein [Coniochaeta ligniaria NRRL 30616]